MIWLCAKHSSCAIWAHRPEITAHARLWCELILCMISTYHKDYVCEKSNRVRYKLTNRGILAGHSVLPTARPTADRTAWVPFPPVCYSAVRGLAPSQDQQASQTTPFLCNMEWVKGMHEDELQFNSIRCLLTWQIANTTSWTTNNEWVLLQLLLSMSKLTHSSILALSCRHETAA